MDEENKTPENEFTPVSPPSMLSFLSYSGRFGRLSFAQALAIIYAVPFVITVVSEWAPTLFIHSLTKIAAIVFIFIALIPMLIRAIALRLHDFNWSGAIVLFVIIAIFVATFILKIPGYWILAPFILILLLIPGNKKSNDYGAPSQKSSYFGLIIFLAMVIVNTLTK
jgi:uncharacterized membrane protein YhaH (DUF805 family)